MSSSAPAITVGMPVYNGEPHLEAAIRSVLEQTQTDFELIIADNASTDATQRICESFARADSRVRYLRNPTNIGAARNYNLLARLARSPYFRWANADDLSHRELHARCLAALEQRRDAVLAYGKTQVIDGQGRVISDCEDSLDLQQESPCERLKAFLDRVGLTNAIYGLMRTSALRRTELMGNGRLAAADIVLMGSLCLQGKFVEVPERLFFRRMHPGASSWDRKDEKRQAAFWGGSGASRLRLPVLKQHAAFHRAIVRADMCLRERIALHGHMLRRLYWSRGAVLAELMRAVPVARH